MYALCVHYMNGIFHISRHQWGLCQLCAFSGVAALVASFVRTECPEGGGGYMGYVRKALEKGYLEHPGSACCTDDMFEIFVRFGQCACCLLPLSINRHAPCLPTTSRNVLLPHLMHHRNLWFAKAHALGVCSGCR